jgi:hypothetical protein
MASRGALLELTFEKRALLRLNCRRDKINVLSSELGLTRPRNSVIKSIGVQEGNFVYESAS